MKKHKDQPLWRDHYELIRDTKSIRNKLKFNFWVIDHFVYKKRVYNRKSKPNQTELF
jgi:hypothetical protein